MVTRLRHRYSGPSEHFALGDASTAPQRSCSTRYAKDEQSTDSCRYIVATRYHAAGLKTDPFGAPQAISILRKAVAGSPENF